MFEDRRHNKTKNNYIRAAAVKSAKDPRIVIAIPDHFRNPGISGLKTRNPGIGISNVCGQARCFNDCRQGLL
jgi:hypothetical protein